MRTRTLLTFLALTAIAARAEAQCEVWDPGFRAASSTNGAVRALCAFDDGSGPALFAAGEYSTIGGVGADAVARWDGASWTPLYFNSGYQDYMQALIVFDDGSGPALYVGGYFPHQIVNYPVLAKWDGGTSWTPLPSLGPFTAGNRVSALAVFDDGSGPALFAGGHFSTAGGVAVLNIARWDGASWSSPGSGLSGTVRALATFDDGSGPALYAGGAFTTAGGAPAARIARWDGTSWSALGSGMDGEVLTLTGFDDGSGPALFAGGAFLTAGGVSAPRAARWDGSSWSALGSPGSGMDGSVQAALVHDAGSGPQLFVGGAFWTAGGVSARYIARWDGSTWSDLGGGTAVPLVSLCAFGDGADGDADLYAGPAYGTSTLAEWHGCGTAAFCFGDGSGAACPCANSGQPGHGCENSAASGGALLAASGTTAPDTLTLTQTGELSGSLSIFLQGSVQLGAPLAFGDGLRCIDGTLLRLYVKSASSGTAVAPVAGDPSILAQSAALGDPIAPGSTRCYQTYYRDPSPGFCPPPQGDEFNVGNALRIAW
jgi:hypothetical protein